MRRKVIQIADSTQLISLPRKWCISHSIKKGDELEVLEDHDKISVFPIGTEKKHERVAVDVSGLHLSAVRTLVAALYKGGYDEFRIRFSDADELLHVQAIIKDSCLGFEIVEQGKDYLVTKKISEPIAEEFDSVLRRTFLFLQNMTKEGYVAVKNNDENALNTVIAMDTSINKFTYFLRRVLNKHGYGPSRVTNPLYFIVDELEEVADRYKYICRVCLQNKKNLSPMVLNFFEQVNELVEIFATLYYKFDWKKINQLYETKKSIDKQGKELIQKINKNEFPILLHLIVIADKVYEMDGPLVLARYEPTSESAISK